MRHDWVGFCCAVWDHDWNQTYRKLMKDTEWPLSEVCKIPINQLYYLLTDRVEERYSMNTKADWDMVRKKVAERRRKRKNHE